MRFVLACVSVLAIACGSSSKGVSDAPGGGGDGSNSNGGDGGGQDSGGNGGGATINVTLNNRPMNAAMYTFVVAYQDGSSAWQLAGAPSNDTYSFHVNSPSWGVVWTCIGNAAGATGGGQIRQVTEVHFAVAERTSLTMDVPPRCTDRPPATVALTGTLANRNGGGGLWVVDFGGRTGFVNGSTGAYRIEAVPGTNDVIARHLVNTGGGTAGDFATVETVVDRAVTVSGATTHDIDASAAVATTSLAVNVVIPQQGRGQATTILYSAGATTSTLDRLSQNFESDVLDPTQRVNGDVYDQQISVASAGQTAIATNATATPSDQTFTAPTPLGGAASAVSANTPYPIIHTTWNAYANTIGYVWTATQSPPQATCGNTPCTIVWAALLSPGVTGGSPGYQMPDLSALSGWSANLAFATGTTVTGYAEAGTSSAGASDFPPMTPPAAGTQRTYVRSDFTVTP